MRIKQLAVAMLIGFAMAAPDDSSTKPTDEDKTTDGDTTKPTKDETTKPEVDPENDDIDTTITYDLSDECARCIKGGYVYCFQGTDGQTLASGTTAPTSECAQTVATSTKQTDTSYTCSNFYTDVEYALTMCYQSQAVCGSEQKIAFS